MPIQFNLKCNGVYCTFSGIYTLACEQNHDLLEDLHLQPVPNEPAALSLSAGLTSCYVTRWQHFLSRRVLLFLWIYSCSHRWVGYGCIYDMTSANWGLFITVYFFSPPLSFSQRSRSDRADAFACWTVLSWGQIDWIHFPSLWLIKYARSLCPGWGLKCVQCGTARGFSSMRQ